ncbi:hypothetical protein [Crenothrix sp.]|uniref:hypothetical protein n=1 Tax=Crenothrix sp. TaxID=3100433 RepID=UPI00374D7ACB
MNAVVKTKDIETIFDHNITSDEILALTDGYQESQEDYLYALDQDSAFADLYRLYSLRGNSDKALFFCDQITDIAFKNQFKARPCCAAHS